MHKKVHNEHKKKIFNRGVPRSSTLLLSLPGCGKSFPHTFFLTNNEPLKKGGKSRALVGSGCSEKMRLWHVGQPRWHELDTCRGLLIGFP